MKNSNKNLAQINTYPYGTQSHKIELLRAIDGFSTVDELSSTHSLNEQDLLQLINEMIDDNIVTYTEDWSQLYWCEGCDLPVWGVDKCGCCERKLTKKIPLYMPSNPKPVDCYFGKILNDFEIEFRDSDLVNVFSKDHFKGFELIRNTYRAEFYYCEKESKWHNPLNHGFSKAKEPHPLVFNVSPLVKANRYRLETIKAEAVDLLKQELSLNGEESVPLLCHSGGKDATVIFHLTQLALDDFRLQNINLLNVNLGMDHPETQQYIENCISPFGERINYIHYDNSTTFSRSVELLGPPTFDNTWCCPQSKKPVKKLLDSFYHQPYISIQGHRKRESMAKLLKADVNAKYLSQKHDKEQALQPIWSWSDMDVWLYIFHNKLKYHPIYDVGIQRLVCFMCPLHSNEELDIVKHRYPELWGEFNETLTEWKHKLGQTDDWVDQNLWKKDFSGKNKDGVNSSKISFIINSLNKVKFGAIEEVSDGHLLEGHLRTTPDIKALSDFVSVTYKPAISGNGTILIALDEKQDNTARIFEEGRLIFSGTNKRTLFRESRELSEILNIFTNCIGCGYCSDSCGCLVVKNGEKVSVSDKAANPCPECTNIKYICPVSKFKFGNYAHFFKGYRKVKDDVINFKY